MKRIALFPSGCLPFHAKTLSERPLGGTETGVIYLAEALTRLGVEVTVLSDLPNPPLSKPLYIPHRGIQFLDEVDVIIGVRDWKTLLLPLKAKKRFFWTGDAYDQPHTVGIGDYRVAHHIDRFLAVSDWQAHTLCETSGFPLEKTAVIRNGINPQHFKGSETRNRKRLIYSSTPYRGLHLLASFFPEILKKHPDAELHIFSGYDVYKGERPFDAHLTEQFRKLSEEFKKIPNVTLHGNIPQEKLAREFMKSGILAYPNTFAETSCITAMEAQAAGCVPVTSEFAALPETVGDGGILIPGPADSPEYAAAFINAIDSLLSDEQRWESFSQRGQARAHEMTWDRVAASVLDLLN